MLLAKLHVLFTFPHFPPLMSSFSIPESNPGPHTAFCLSIFMVSSNLGQFLRLPWSFMTLILGMSTGHCFAECLSFWVCQVSPYD